MGREQLYIRTTLNHDGFPEYAESRGVKVSRLRHELGLESGVIARKGNFVSWNSVCTFYERAAAEIKDPYLGIRYALEAKPDFSGIGPVIYLGSLSTDIRSFFKAIERYQSIRTNGINYSIVEDFDKNETIGRYLVNKDSAACYQFFENTLGLAALTARKLIPGFQVKYVSFTHNRPQDISLYEQVFDAPVYFEAEENRLVSDMDYYKLEASQLSLGFRDFALKAYFDGRTHLIPDAQQSITGFVKIILPSVMGTNACDLGAFAKSLNMHSKKLQRLLKYEGSNFSNIRDDIRKELAGKLLVNTKLSISHIANLLEYSSDRPFTAAFKRWHDLTPSEYRMTVSI